MVELFLGLTMLFHTSDFQLRQAIHLSNHNQYRESEVILGKINPYKTRNPDTYHFFRLLNNFAMNKQPEAQKYLNTLNDSFTSESLPQRYQTLTSLMATDMKTWKKDDLGDISRDMRHVATRLKLPDGSKQVRKTQKDIVDRLDKLIKQMEDKAKGKGEGVDNNQTNQAKNVPTPQKDSVIGNEGGTGNVQNQRMRKIIERWGSMPERERTRAVQELIAGMPSRYCEAVTNYFRNLTKLPQR